MKIKNIFYLLALFPLVAYSQTCDNKSDTGSCRNWIIGGAIGSPFGLSFVGGVQKKPLSYSISGGFAGKNWYGVQCDVSKPIIETGELTQSIALIAGVYATTVYTTDSETGSKIKQHNKQNYIGLAYDVNYSGFFLQAGLGAGKGDYANPQLLFQFGYLFKIN